MLGASKYSPGQSQAKTSLLGGLVTVESFECQVANEELHQAEAKFQSEEEKQGALKLLEALQEDVAEAPVAAISNDSTESKLPSSQSKSRKEDESIESDQSKKPAKMLGDTEEDLYQRKAKGQLDQKSKIDDDLYERQQKKKRAPQESGPLTSAKEEGNRHSESAKAPAHNKQSGDDGKDNFEIELLAKPHTAGKKEQGQRSTSSGKSQSEDLVRPLAILTDESEEEFSFIDELPSPAPLETSKEQKLKNVRQTTAEENSHNFLHWKTLKSLPFSKIWGKKGKDDAPAKRNVKSPTQEELNFFFRATDDELLYNLGDSFYRDYKSGLKHFGFASVNSQESQQRSILGIASFIKYFEDNRILIITDKMEGTFFEVFKREATRVKMEIGGLPGFHYNVHQGYSLNFLEMDELAVKAKTSKVRIYPTIIKNLMADYDVVLVDLPSQEARRSQYDLYLPVLQSLNHATLTVSLKKSLFSEVNELRQYFASYKIKIKGSVVERLPRSTIKRAADRRPSL